MGQDRVWDKDAERERKRRYREQKKLVEQTPSEEPLEEPVQPVPGVDLVPSLDVRPLDVLLVLPDDAPLNAAEEQALRDHYGYAPTETRTRAQRAQHASRMLEEESSEELPADVLAVWASPADQWLAWGLIEAWGLDGFRSSMTHKLALQEQASQVKRVANQRAFLASRH